MRNLKTTRIVLVLSAICVSLMMLIAPAGVAVKATNDRRAAANIRIAPPAPVFSDKDRVAELAQRRERVAQSIGPKSFLVLFSTEPRVYSNSVNYPYRQENNLYYLTNLKQKNATLVLLPGNTKFKEVLFLPRRNPLTETWDGHMYSPEEAQDRKSTRLNSSHLVISYAVFCLKKKKKSNDERTKAK